MRAKLQAFLDQVARRLPDLRRVGFTLPDLRRVWHRLPDLRRIRLSLPDLRQIRVPDLSAVRMPDFRRVGGWKWLRLPDLRRMPFSRQVTWAVIFSVWLHFALLMVLGILSWLMPGLVSAPEKVVARQPIEIEVEMIPAPPEAAPKKPPAPQTVAMIDAEGLAESKESPTDVQFESSQNMAAASANAPTGLLPLPSQEGANLPFQQFKDQQAKLGKVADAAEPPSPPPVTETPPAVPVVDAPKTDPEEQKPKENDIPLFRRTVAKEALSRETQERVKPTPVPQKPVATPVPQLAMLTSPKPVKDPGYQPEQRQTRVEGSISNRGTPGVAAIKTPMGVYRQKLSAQIQSRWQYYTKQRMDLLAIGTVRVRFFVTQDGRVQNVQVTDNDSNQSFADVCERAIREAEIPPPPPELELMKDGRLELAFSFTLYSSH